MCLVINRLVSLISANATLTAEKEAALKQAQSASRAAEAVMSAGGDDESPAAKELKEKVNFIFFGYVIHNHCCISPTKTFDISNE